MISFSIPFFHSFILRNYISTNVLFKGLPVAVDLSIYMDTIASEVQAVL